LNRKKKVFLILGITGVTSLLTLLLIEDWVLGFAGVPCVFLISMMLVDPLNSKARREVAKKEDSNEESEISGVETRAVVDSRIYERPSFFLGILFIIVYGGIGSKYESIFSIEYEGKIIVVLYHDLCLVSAGDRLNIRGNWYRGKKLGIQRNVVVAHRVENLNTELVFSRD
jgi:hypothetical protein